MEFKLEIKVMVDGKRSTIFTECSSFHWLGKSTVVALENNSLQSAGTRIITDVVSVTVTKK